MSAMTAEMILILQKIEAIQNAAALRLRQLRDEGIHNREMNAEARTTAEFGPILRFTAWFGCDGDAAAAKRFQRAAGRLVKDGLTEDLSGNNRLTSLRLPPWGVRN